MQTIYEQKEVNDETFVRCNDLDEFRTFCEDGFWGDEVGFKQDTGLDYKDLLGRWFSVVHSRVYIEENLEL